MGVGLLDCEQSSVQVPLGPSRTPPTPLESEEFPRENPSTLLLFMLREMTESRRSEQPVCKCPLSQSGSFLLILAAPGRDTGSFIFQSSTQQGRQSQPVIKTSDLRDTTAYNCFPPHSETESCYRTLAGFKLPMQTRLIANLRGSSCFYLLMLGLQVCTAVSG